MTKPRSEFMPPGGVPCDLPHSGYHTFQRNDVTGGNPEHLACTCGKIIGHHWLEPTVCEEGFQDKLTRTFTDLELPSKQRAAAQFIWGGELEWACKLQGRKAFVIQGKALEAANLDEPPEFTGRRYRP